ncbi:MAG: HAD family phosphatase [Anaerolineae bacterium]|nr:HAD family phosphatase [Anaerolineae bacterium]
MIKAIIFDFHEVLVRTEDYGPRHAWDQCLGLATGSVERAVRHSDIWIQAQLGRIMPKAYWLGVAELLYMRDITQIEQLRHDFFSGDRLNYRLIELIHDLREGGYRVALLSNDTVELEIRLRQFEIYDLFDHVLISSQTGIMKPDPAAYRVALQSLQVAARETVFTDDSLMHIRSAQTLGIHTILYRPETDLRAEIMRLINEQAD